MSGLEDRKIVGCENHWKWDIHTKECWFSTAWCHNLGYEPGDLINHEDTWKSLIHKDCMPKVSEKLQPVISGVKNNYECIYRLRNKSNKYIWHLDTGRVIERDAFGVATLMEGYDLPLSC
jgi:hypothetical protein